MDAKQNFVSPVWKPPFESECDQDELDRLRADCEVTHLKHSFINFHITGIQKLVKCTLYLIFRISSMRAYLHSL